MSFGVEVKGVDASGQFTIANTDLNLSHFVVTAIGYGTSAPKVGSNSKIFINSKNLPGRTIIVNEGSNSYGFQQVTVTHNPDFSTFTAVTITTAPISLYYFVIAEAKSIPVPTGSAGDYGLQIFKSDGSVAFDSRRLQTNVSFYIKEFYTLNGSSGSIVTTDLNAYVEPVGTAAFGESRSGLIWNSFGVTYVSNFWSLNVSENAGAGAVAGSVGGGSGTIPPTLIAQTR